LSGELKLVAPSHFELERIKVDPYEPARGAQVVWMPATDFGAFVRGLRTGRSMSLRKAAQRIGMSHTFVAQVERDEPSVKLSVELCERMALSYSADPREVLERAGVMYAVADPSLKSERDSLREMVLRLLSHERLGPTDFHPSEMRHISDRSIELMFQLAQKAYSHGVVRGEPVLDIMMARAGGEE